MSSTSWSGKNNYAFMSSPRCGAKTKSNNGLPCRCPAVKGKQRCYVHGGAKGSGAPIGNTNRLKHGQASKQTKLFKKQVRQAIATANAMSKEIG